MNTLERITLGEAIRTLYIAIANVYEKEVGRQEDLRIHTEAKIESAIEILEAIMDNDKEKRR